MKEIWTEGTLAYFHGVKGGGRAVAESLGWSPESSPESRRLSIESSLES